MFEAMFKFKQKSNREALEGLAKSGIEISQPDGLTAFRFMNHINVVDQIFKAHLTNTSHPFEAANTPETPSLDELRARITELDEWFVGYASSMTTEQLNEPIEFTFTDGKQGRMLREEILLHVLAHGIYHRGAVGLILQRQGAMPPPETFTRYLHELEPFRRDAV
ncbi:DinB family protein [Pseudomonas sp. SLFW]|uniref:DinB family protein n=1 Tax=Pseudomonas sp. SLFW TaxID=2683259 RepID=UPI0014126CA6|nr:DinB family protein [Pseudomonas sp. SLFW]NBB10102.1 damage-inducible protein DinB [Pseudomonas sp. SLFW]